MSHTSLTYDPAAKVADEQYRSHLSIFLTPSCTALSLSTPRLLLRQVTPSDIPAIKRIKLEPSVQRTQLYGSPHESVIRDWFVEAYVRASIPRTASSEHNSRCREKYVFAITLKHPGEVRVGAGRDIRAESRISDAEGYIGGRGPLLL